MIRKISLIASFFAALSTIIAMEDPNRDKPHTPTPTTPASTSFTVINNPADPAQDPVAFFANELSSLLDQLNTSVSARELIRKLNDALLYYQRLEDTLQFTHGLKVPTRFAQFIPLHIRYGIEETFLKKLKTLPIEEKTTLKSLHALETKINNYYKLRAIAPLNLREYVTSTNKNKPEQSREITKRKRNEDPTFKKPLTPTRPSKQHRCPTRAMNNDISEFEQKINELKSTEADDKLHENLTQLIPYFNSFFTKHGFLNKYISPYSQALFSKITLSTPEYLKEFIENTLLELSLQLFHKNLNIPKMEQLHIISFNSLSFLPYGAREALLNRIELNEQKKLNKG